MKIHPLNYALPATLLIAGMTAMGIGLSSFEAATAQTDSEKNPYKYEKGKYDKGDYKYEKGKYEKGKYDQGDYKYEKGKYDKGDYKYEKGKYDQDK